jgi:ATP-dependent Clp protease ATP-binding subunit ClpC
MVAQVADRLRAERGIELSVDDALVSRLAREGFDEAYGARPLKRHVRRTLERELTRAILDGTLAEGTRVTARDGDEGIALDVAPLAAAPAPSARLAA